MNKLLCRFACLAAFCLSTSAQAAVLTFNSPELIDIDTNFVATYPESGFLITGDAPFFLPLDGIGTGGTGGLQVSANSLISLMPSGGGLFRLIGLDYAAFDLFDIGFDPSASLVVTGLLNGGGTLEQTVLLNDLAFSSLSFQSWNNLIAVSFLATADFALDNIEAAQIPEPASLALVSVGLMGLALARRRRRPVAHAAT